MFFPPLSPAQILAEERVRVRETWSPNARAASIAVRQGRAAYDKDLANTAKGKAKDFQRKTKPKPAGKKPVDPKVAEFDGKIKASAENLYQMAQRGERGTAAYKQAYKAHQALKDARTVAAGGAHKVEAPETPKKGKKPGVARGGVAKSTYRKTSAYSGRATFRGVPI